MKNWFTLVAAGTAVVATTACGSDRPASVSAPTAATAINPAAPPAAPSFGSARSLVGHWVSESLLSGSSINPAATISLAVCTNIRLNVTSETATQAVGTLSMSCPEGIELTGTIVGQLGGSTIPLTWTGTATQGSFPACPFALSGTGTPLGGEMFRLTYSGNTCVGPVNGSDDLRFASTAPAPTPAPAPAGPATDAVPMSSMVIKNSPLNLASWPITTKINVAELRPTGIYLDFSKRGVGPGKWPDIIPPGWDGPLQWTLGMALKINGQWYASAPVQFWKELEQSGGEPQNYALNWFYDPGRWAPMTGHQPAVGEQIGLFACAGDCRNNPGGTLSPAKERSNVVMVTMPGPGGARFVF